MENNPGKSPPRRKLSRLNRAKDHEVSAKSLSQTLQPLEPANSRLNKQQEPGLPAKLELKRFHAETNGESPRQVAGQSNHQENEASTPECASENPAAANQAEGMQSFPSPADSAKTANNQDGDQQSDKHTEADSEDNRNASSPARSGSKGAGSELTFDSDEGGDAASTLKTAKDHWDEEDELEDYLRRNLSSSKAAESDGANNKSDAEEGREEGSGGSQAESGTLSEAEASGADSPAPLAGPDLQRQLREQGQRECIGRAAPAEIQPMDSVLAKIRAIADAAATRAAKTARMDLPPASAQKQRPGFTAENENEDDDIIIESEDDQSMGTEAGGSGSSMPAVPLRLAIGSETQQDMPFFEDRRLRASEAEPNPARLSVQAPKAQPFNTQGSRASPPNHAQPAAVSQQEAQEGSEEDEAEASFSDEDSSSEDEEDEGTDPEEARRLALEEARTMLRDRKAKSQDQYFEDEAEMSEDGGHSDDEGNSSDGDGGHAELLEGLIGHEREKRGDERLRAAAHARWLADQDESDVQRLMDGMKNGFRKPRRPAFLLDTEGDLADSRRRRAAVDAGELLSAEDADSSEEPSSSDSDEDEEAGPALKEVSAGYVSDDEARETLQRYQQQKMLEASQSSQQVELDLLDDDSQALLSKVMPERSRHNTGPLKSVAKTVLDVDEERVTASTASFLGRAAHISAAIRTNSQNNTRSYVFGCENSNSAQILEGEEGDQKAAKAKGPTNFTGIKRSNGGAASLKGGQLLSILHPMSNHPAQKAEAEGGKIDFSSVLLQNSLPKAKITRLK